VAEVEASAEESRATDGRRRLLGLGGLALLCAVAVPLAAPGAGLVPAAGSDPPRWLLGVFAEGFGVSPGLYYGLLWAALVAHLAVVVAAPALGRRAIVGVSAVLIVAFALAPPLLSADVFSYVDYARLAAEHGLNPYTHTPEAVAGDPAYPYVGWTESESAYGPLFTLLTLPLGVVAVPVALWSLKALAAVAVLALAWIVARLAPLRGLDPVRAFAIVALNPLVLVHVVGGAHNDAVMALALTAGVGAVLVGAERSGGFAVVAAVGIKVSAAFAAPFALLGAADRPRFLAGAAVALLAIGSASLLAFGPDALGSLAVAGENQGRVSSFSAPNLLSEALNVDVDAVRTGTLLAYLALLAALLRWVWRGGDWLRAAGWAALGLLLASSWLLPWYVVWALPFAALARDDRLLTAVLALTALQLAARIPL
jgi:Glycosyltransferase family 87